MKKKDIIRAWREPKYRHGLTAEQKAQLPAHPAAWMVGLEDDVLAGVTGGCCNPGECSTAPRYCSAFVTPCPPKQCY